MLKARIYNLVRRLQGMPCPACAAPRRVEWREGITTAGGEGADNDSPTLCERCGHPRPVDFIEVCRC